MGDLKMAACVGGRGRNDGRAGPSQSYRTVGMLRPHRARIRRTVGTGGPVNSHEDEVLITPATTTQPAQYRERTYHRRTITVLSGNLGERTVDIVIPGLGYTQLVLSALRLVEHDGRAAINGGDPIGRLASVSRSFLRWLVEELPARSCLRCSEFTGPVRWKYWSRPPTRSTPLRTK